MLLLLLLLLARGDPLVPFVGFMDLVDDLKRREEHERYDSIEDLCSSSIGAIDGDHPFITVIIMCSVHVYVYV